MSREDSGSQPSYYLRRVSRREVLKGAAVVLAGAAIGPVVAGCGGSNTTTTAGTAGGAGTTAAGTGTTAAGGGSAAKPGGHLRVAAGAGSAKEDLNIHAPALTMPSLGHALQPVRLAARVQCRRRARHGPRRRALAQRRRDAVHGQAQEGPRRSTMARRSTRTPSCTASSGSLDPKNPGLAAKQLRGLEPGGTKKVDDLTVRFELSAPNAIFPEALSAYSAGIVPVGYNPKGGQGVIGTGPFKLASPGDFQPGRAGGLREEPEVLAPGRRALRRQALVHRVRRQHRPDERPARRRRRLLADDPRRAAQDRRGRRLQVARDQDRLVDPLHDERQRQAVRRRARAPGVPAHRRPSRR